MEPEKEKHVHSTGITGNNTPQEVSFSMRKQVEVQCLWMHARV